MSLFLHAAVAAPLARQLLGSTAVVATVAAFLLMVSNTDWFVVPLVFAVVTGTASIAFGVISGGLLAVAVFREWRQR